MFFKISQLCIYGTLYDIWVLKISWSIEVPGYLRLDPFLFLEWQSDKDIGENGYFEDFEGTLFLGK